MDDLHRGAVVLLEYLYNAFALGQGGLGIGIQIGAELGKALQLTVLAVNQLKGTRNRLHGLDLRSAADTGNRNAGIDGGHNAGMEQLGFQEDLAIGDGDDIGGDVGGNIAGLGFDDGQRGKGTAALFLGKARGALQQAGMQIEYIAWVGFTARRAPDEQG